MEGQYYSPEIYDEDKTFDSLTVWNEYQTTGETTIPVHDPDDILSVPDVRKKFRIWRLGIPRASVTESNNFGLDRIRNPWVFVKLKKNSGNFGQQLMQLHDVTVKYFEE